LYDIKSLFPQNFNHKFNQHLMLKINVNINDDFHLLNILFDLNKKSMFNIS